MWTQRSSESYTGIWTVLGCSCVSEEKAPESCITVIPPNRKKTSEFLLLESHKHPSQVSNQTHNHLPRCPVSGREGWGVSEQIDGLSSVLRLAKQTPKMSLHRAAHRKVWVCLLSNFLSKSFNYRQEGHKHRHRHRHFFLCSTMTQTSPVRSRPGCFEFSQSSQHAQQQTLATSAISCPSVSPRWIQRTMRCRLWWPWWIPDADESGTAAVRFPAPAPWRLFVGRIVSHRDEQTTTTAAAATLTTKNFTVLVCSGLCVCVCVSAESDADSA